MEKITKILFNIRNGIPMALSRFNDGECGIIFNKDFTAARGCQKGSVELQVALIDAITHEQENYFKGYPCPVCYRKLWKPIKKKGYYNPDYKYNTMAVVNTNRNLDRFANELPVVLNGYQVVCVTGKDQDVSKLDIDVKKHITTPLKNSWVHYNDILQQCLDNVMPHRVFLFSTGPTSRVLVKNLFQMRPDASFLDIGDTFSPITRGVYRKCHTGELKECPGCN